MFKEQYKKCLKFVEEPHLFVYLKTSTDMLLNRIQRRGRDNEQSIGADYLDRLSFFYDEFFRELKAELKNSEVLVIETDGCDSVEVLDVVLKHLKHK